MFRFLSMVALIAGVSPPSLAQLRLDQQEGPRGEMTAEELQREPIRYELDIPYADTGNQRHRLDLYIPKMPNSDILPVMVFIHGGGWARGDKSDGAGRIMPFVRTGDFAGISIGYRLSDEVTWPQPLYDCKAAIRWIRANAARYRLDPDRIGVWGRSAGGHLALMVGVTADVPELEGDLGPHTDTSSRVACVCNFFGVTDIPALVGQPSDIDRTRPDAPEAKLLGGPLQDNLDRAVAASPVTYVTDVDPPVLTVHGDSDRTVPYDQAARLDAALHRAGVPSYLVTVEGAGHGDFGRAANARVAAFFGKYLRGQEVDILTASIEKP